MDKEKAKKLENYINSNQSDTSDCLIVYSLKQALTAIIEGPKDTMTDIAFEMYIILK
jgi:hypothetical protein